MCPAGRAVVQLQQPQGFDISPCITFIQPLPHTTHSPSVDTNDSPLPREDWLSNRRHGVCHTLCVDTISVSTQATTGLNQGHTQQPATCLSDLHTTAEVGNLPPPQPRKLLPITQSAPQPATNPKRVTGNLSKAVATDTQDMMCTSCIQTKA